MATYKKRGYKPKTKEDKQAAIEDNSQTAEIFNTLDEGASKTEDWVIKNQKYIFILIGLVAAVVLGYLGYNKFVKGPNEEQATNDMFQAQQYFEQAVNGTSTDSLYTLALNGADGKFGMLDIVKNYGGTKAGNLANYYAGVSYLKLKDYTNAIDYLEDFSGEGTALGPISKGAIGDAFVQLDQKDVALGYYEKAFNLTVNEYTTPMYLFKAGILAMDLGDNAKAATYFNRIKDEFPDSSEATSIDTFIGRAEAASN